MSKKVIRLIIIVIFFLFGTIQPLYSLSKILIYGGLFEYNFTYLRAAGAALAGKSIYSFGDINYPPVALFLFVPFRFLSVFWGQLVWTIPSLLCLFLVLYFSFKILNIDWGWRNLFWILPLTLLAFPTKWTLGLGQVNNLILLLVVLGFFFYRRGKFFLSGVSLGLATSLKIIPVALLLYFLIKKEFKVFVSGLMTIIALFLLSGLVFGFHLIGEYFLKVMPATLGMGGKSIYYNQAVSGFFSRLINNGSHAAIATAIFSFLMIVITFCFLLRRKKANALGYSLVICTTLLVNSFSWQHHFVLLIFPFLVTFSYIYQKGQWFVRENSKLEMQSSKPKLKTKSFRSCTGIFRFSLLSVSYLLVSYNVKHPELLGTSFLAKILLSHVFLGNLLLWGILIKEINHRFSEL